MNNDNSAIARVPKLLSTEPPGVDGAAPPGQLSPGVLWGLLGVVAFSFTVPFTRIAVTGGLSPVFVGTGRAVVAGVLAVLVLGAAGQLRGRLTGSQWRRLFLVAGGVVVGFPVCTSFALQDLPASHGAVTVALLPAATAVITVLRTGERPGVRFWAAALCGAVVAVTAGVLHGGTGGVATGDLLLLLAVVAGGIGYAEGGLLSREIGSWQTICRALVLALPLTTLCAVLSRPDDWFVVDGPAWASLAYLSVVSMFLGFFAWYRGLAYGPMVQVSQIQLVQPVLSIAWAVLMLGEPVSAATVLAGAGVIVCAATAVRSRS
ncbi:MAG: DMT family transporter [Corynebacterium provencense]|uniref:DMT family transporter n=1 Tax=Corynebacterium provencense TaxID=1737425 RepID=UPI002989A5DB|nr:DMT family transporter [Corynebacterium provencense]